MQAAYSRKQINEADELRLVRLLLLRALEKPQLRNRRGVGFGDAIEEAMLLLGHGQKGNLKP